MSSEFKNGKVSAHFTEKDLTCNDGCGTYIPDKNLIQTLEVLRAHLRTVMGYECYIIVHCTVRCENHNKRIGGVTSSRHLPKYFKKGQGACDFHVRGISNSKLREICKKLWKKKDILVGGLGLYDWGVHIDNSSYRRWGKWWYKI
jgi:uncharacterized protein YcbK (DUF882 family)